jgi:hypothetical protein
MFGFRILKHWTFQTFRGPSAWENRYIERQMQHKRKNSGTGLQLCPERDLNLRCQNSSDPKHAHLILYPAWTSVAVQAHSCVLSRIWTCDANIPVILNMHIYYRPTQHVQRTQNNWELSKRHSKMGGKDGKSKRRARLSTFCLSMYSITENIHYSQLSSVAKLVSHRIIQANDCVFSSSVLSSFGLPLPLTCLLLTVREARSYFVSTTA